ncbi:hypothetical protein HOE425_331659 [Hoeflea sp. EC-HK425]|nr:hypothetical protein HOE425_331659 [Hoeflea sp. EC-HK425]
MPRRGHVWQRKWAWARSASAASKIRLSVAPVLSVNPGPSRQEAGTDVARTACPSGDHEKTAAPGAAVFSFSLASAKCRRHRTPQGGGLPEGGKGVRKKFLQIRVESNKNNVESTLGCGRWVAARPHDLHIM